jgi:tRNA-binding protein
MASFSDFRKLDIRCGTVRRAEAFEGLRNPAYKLWIDFGSEIGMLKSSAQITHLYSIEDLLEVQVLALVNIPPKQISNFMSECLVLGLPTEKGVVLIKPDKAVENGLALE